MKHIPPRIVRDGPVLENIQRGKDVNILKFPTPRWFELDGGRYIGTGSVNITHDPEEGWTNLGTARVMIHDENTVGFYIAPGRHGRIHRDKAFARGESFKVAISVGHDPLIFLAGALEVPYGVCEYDFIGGIQGEPVDVIEGEFTGLPIPATAEIVLEGECVARPGKNRRAVRRMDGLLRQLVAARADRQNSQRHAPQRSDPVGLHAQVARAAQGRVGVG